MNNASTPRKERRQPRPTQPYVLPNPNVDPFPDELREASASYHLLRAYGSGLPPQMVIASPEQDVEWYVNNIAQRNLTFRESLPRIERALRTIKAEQAMLDRLGNQLKSHCAEQYRTDLQTLGITAQQFEEYLDARRARSHSSPKALRKALRVAR